MGREILCLESSSTTPVCPWDIANSIAVSPMRFETPRLTSFRSNINFTTPSCPLPAAHESGVRLFKASVALELMSFCSSSNFTASSSLFSEAQEISVRSEKVSVVLGLISARLNSYFTILSWLPLGTRPYSVSAALRLISSLSNSNISTSSFPPFAAHQSGVRPFPYLRRRD